MGSWSDNFEYKSDQGTIFCYTHNADGSWSDRGKTGGGAWGRSNSNLKVGWSVSQDGGYQVAGAPGDSSNRGAAYVRQRVQEDLNGDGDMSDSGEAVTRAKGFVVEPDTGAGDLFGTSVALKWPYLLVGAPSHGTGGASFLYEFNTTWHKVQKFESPSMQAVGTSVSLSDGLALTGAAGRAILNFRSAPLSATMTCGGSCGDGCAPTSGAMSGTFSDGSGNYGNNENCWWLIEAPGAEISVSFSSFNTESCCDRVYIYRCDTAECVSPSQILRHAGSQVPKPYMHTHAHSCYIHACIHTSHAHTHTHTHTTGAERHVQLVNRVPQGDIHVRRLCYYERVHWNVVRKCRQFCRAWRHVRRFPSSSSSSSSSPSSVLNLHTLHRLILLQRKRRPRTRLAMG